ncbi:MAG: choice-of-anchor V domain-containing protein [Ignavibacteria bacterium]|jgi:hypothetical protein
MKKIVSVSVTMILSLTIGINCLLSFNDGIFGLTKRDGAIGCICHGGGNPSPSVRVWFVGPDSVAAGQSAVFKLYLAHGPAITGGLDVASYLGVIDTLPIDTILQRKAQTNELSHKYPKPFVNDTVYWTFKYTAPLTPMYDTLYANGNSTNNNGIPDSLDKWNFADNFIIRVYNPIGIRPISSIANTFSLSQNYPNPFNPTTKIRYSLHEKSYVTLDIFDITGRGSALIVDKLQDPGEHEITFDGKRYSSGVYFYRLSVFSLQNDSKLLFSSIKKMILVK